MALAFKVKKIRNVTLPLLKIKPGVEYYIKFLGAMHIGKEIAPKPDANGEIKARQPAHIAQVINLETREEVQIICSTVFRKELQDMYAGDSYVGKCFEFAITKVEGKAYNLVTIAEIAEPEYENEGGETAPESKPAPTGKKK